MPKSTLTSYVFGFAFSLALTFAAFLTVIRPGFLHLGGSGVVATIIALALAQFLVQLFFFLHLGQESKPRWKLVVLLSTIAIVLILVLGSIWIMNNLNYNMTPAQVNAYMQDQGAF